MAANAYTEGHLYSLLVDEDRFGPPKRIDLEGAGTWVPMQFAQRAMPERDIELLEDGESLGTIKCTREGYWIMLPKRAPASNIPIRRCSENPAAHTLL